MAGTDLAYDHDGDFVDDGAGGWVETDSIAPAVRHQALDKRGLWWADRNAGNAAWSLPKKATRRIMALHEDAWREALQVFVDAQLATDLDIAVTNDQLGRFALEGSLVDTQAGELDLTPLLATGLEP
jgi:phage gp46-like protein